MSCPAHQFAAILLAGSGSRSATLAGYRSHRQVAGQDSLLLIWNTCPCLSPRTVRECVLVCAKHRRELQATWAVPPGLASEVPVISNLLEQFDSKFSFSRWQTLLFSGKEGCHCDCGVKVKFCTTQLHLYCSVNPCQTLDPMHLPRDRLQNPARGGSRITGAQMITPVSLITIGYRKHTTYECTTCIRMLTLSLQACQHTNDISI